MTETSLAERLVERRLCGEVATRVGSCVGNARRLVAGDPDYTFGLSDWRRATFDDAVAAVEALGGGRLRGYGDDDLAYIDPVGTLAGIERHRQVLGGFAAGGGTVLVATGHPVLLTHYARVVDALSRAGCRLLAPLDDGRFVGPTADGTPCSIAYVDRVAVLFHTGAPRHTHRPEYMEAMLDDLGDQRPDLVVADHGFAGAAVEAGIPTISIADVNDPALPLAQARGRTQGVLLVDDGLPPEVFAPVTEAILAWAGA